MNGDPNLAVVSLVARALGSRDEIQGYLADQTFIDQLEWIFPDGRSEIVIRRLRSIAR